MKSITDFGRIISNAYYDSLEKIIFEDEYCVCLDPKDFSEYDYDIFIKELRHIDNTSIDGYTNSLNDLDNLTFLGSFILNFVEGQKYKDDIERITDSLKYE